MPLLPCKPLQAVKLEPLSPNLNFNLLFFLYRNFSSKIYYNQYGINCQVTAKEALRNIHMDLL